MNKETLKNLIANGENSGVEFKRDNIRPEKLAKEVVALANLQGGYIFLGVDDDGTVVGVTRSNLNEWIGDTVFGRYVHPTILPYFEDVVMDDGKRVTVITIGKEGCKPYVVRHNDTESAYVRIGSVSRLATREQLLRLGASSGLVHTEIMPVYRTGFDSLDMVRLRNYIQDILKDPDVPYSDEEWITRLKALGFMTDGVDGQAVCTIAGLVLFGINPRQVLKQAGMRLMFFDSYDKEYQAKLDKVIDAPMLGRFKVGKAGKTLIDGGLIEKTLDLIEPFVTIEPNEIDDNFRREKLWLYPYEAIRELLINALVHREWSSFVDVEMSGYIDRLEITSPGSLPNSMTIEKMLAGQRSSRNNIIVEVLRDYGYVDARGMGVRTKVIPSLKQNGTTPVFEATDDYVKSIVAKTKSKDIKIAEDSAGYRDRNVDKNNETQKEMYAGNKDVTQELYQPLETVDNETKERRKKLSKTSKKILTICKGNSSITIVELSEIIGISTRSVERNIQKLRNSGLLVRIGGRKKGSWEVIDE
jgi:ATP-dependent DNA helicase RecG